MKTSVALFALSALCALTAVGQVLSQTGTTVSLSSAGTTTIASVSANSGVLASIGCTVTAAPGSVTVPTAVITTTLGASSQSYDMYTSSNAFAPTLFPFLKVAASLSTWGSSVGDSFQIPVGVTYPGNFTVSVDVTSASSAGTLFCVTTNS